MNEIPLCACGCKNQVAKSQVYPYGWNKFILGHNNNRKGAKGPKRSIEVIEKAKATFQANFTLEKRKKYSEAAIARGSGKWMEGRHLSIKTKEKQSKSLKGKNIGKKRSIETKEIKSKQTTALWQTPEYVQKQMKARGVSPNKIELSFQDILDSLYPNEWKFVGVG